MTALGAGRVFISHSADDAAIASDICAAIEARGIPCWIAPRNVRAGDDFLESIQAAIESAPAFVLVLSRASSLSPFVLSETQVAFDYKRPIFPVRIEKVDPSGSLRMLLSRWHRVDAIGPGREGGIRRLAEAVSRRVATGTGARDTRGSRVAVAEEPARRRNWPAIAALAAAAAAILLLVIALATAGGPAETDPRTGLNDTVDALNAEAPPPGRVDEGAIAAQHNQAFEDAFNIVKNDVQNEVIANLQNGFLMIPLPPPPADPGLANATGL